MTNLLVMFTFLGSKNQNCLFMLKLGTKTNSNECIEFDGINFGLEISFLEKVVRNYSRYCKFLFKLFNLIMSSFCFGKLV